MTTSDGRIKANYLAVNGAGARSSPALGRNPSAVELAHELGPDIERARGVES